MYEKTVYKFDRKTFDPKTNREHYKIHNALVRQGFSRSCNMRQLWENDWKADLPNIWYGVASTALIDTLITDEYKRIKDGVVLDAGCGMSPDVNICIRTGFKKAYAMDLIDLKHFHRSKVSFPRVGVEFIQGDFVEKIPLHKRSVDLVISQAVLDLVEPESRPDFYENVYNILKKGGLFAVFFQSLKHGHGFIFKNEVEQIKAHGFKRLKGCGTSVLFSKL